MQIVLVGWVDCLARVQNAWIHNVPKRLTLKNFRILGSKKLDSKTLGSKQQHPQCVPADATAVAEGDRRQLDMANWIRQFFLHLYSNSFAISVVIPNVRFLTVDFKVLNVRSQTFDSKLFQTIIPNVRPQTSECSIEFFRQRSSWLCWPRMDHSEWSL